MIQFDLTLAISDIFFIFQHKAQVHIFFHLKFLPIGHCVQQDI